MLLEGPRALRAGGRTHARRANTNRCYPPCAEVRSQLKICVGANESPAAALAFEQRRREEMERKLQVLSSKRNL